MRNLTSNLPPITVKLAKYERIQSLPLADPNFNCSSPIDVLLGGDIFMKLLRPEKYQLDDDLFAQNTSFGYVISGKAALEIDQNSIPTYDSVTACYMDLHDTMQRFWEVEEIGILGTETEHWCETHFRESTFKDGKSGKYVVRLPFKPNASDLGDSLPSAIRRLFAMERRFIKSSELKADYTKFMREYLALGNMSLIQHKEIHSSTHSKIYYLPHHAVVKDSSSTTKLRVVFDGSSKSSSGVSLNDKLDIGPPILQELFSILVRFRKHKVAFAADVEKMFRQVMVHQEDRDYRRIVWREDTSLPILHYRLNTVTYGTACATFLASRTLHQIADDLPPHLIDAKDIIKSDFYVDDLLSGCANVTNAKDLQAKIVEGLLLGGFKLRKWVSNSQEFLSSIPKDEQERLIEISSDDAYVKTLGLVWITNSDCFTFKINKTDSDPSTKRNLLSIASRIFDPLGFLSPSTVMTKILFQGLWLHKIDWDDPLPDKIKSDWERIHSNFQLFEKIQIPRFMNIPLTDNTKVELHGFSDASEKAYAAVVYLRAVDLNGVVSMRLIAAKTKVAPLKQVCLPRLELCAAVLLVKLITKLVRSLNMPNLRAFGWTDSTIVLAWLSDVPRRWKTFIGNRTSFILDRLPRVNWDHVNSEINPADLASRGIFPDQLIGNLLWWEGPGYLSESPDHWPKVSDGQLSNISFDELEPKKSFVYTALTSSRNQTDFSAVANLFERSSSFYFVIRTFAQCYRFFDRFKNKQISLYLTGSQIKRATMLAVRWSQHECFSDDINRISAGSNLQRGSKLRSLNPFIDDQGTLRVGGRIGLTTCCSYDAKHPAIIDAHHPFTEILTRTLHKRYLHPTQQQLLGIMRQNYWIIGAKTLVKRIARLCVTCTRHRLKTTQQQMGNLPSFRITPSRAFSTVGVDFAGPVKVKSKTGRGAKIYKCYVAVFVCLVVKAVHIELVSDLTTDAFMACLKRFISRRGIPKQIYSDNGTNFVGANRKISQLFKDSSQINNNELRIFLNINQIDWHFVPPSSPHFGGIWESGVKSMKRHLIRTIGKSALTFEEYCTLLCQIECLLNSRPIAPMDTHFAENCEVLTPGHFSMGCSPKFLHGSVRHIEISRTYLQSVDDETFQGLRLESLKLVDNKISEFSEKSFSSMVHSLLSLDISGNRLQHLPLKSLRNIHTLSRIIAQRNNIQDLDGNWGNLIDSLRSIHLSSNSIGDLIAFNYDERKSNHTSSLPVGSAKPFSKLRKLVWLDISNNRVSHINTNLLPKSLMTIDVSRNLLTLVPITLFEHLKDIKILLFKDNLIKSLANLNELPLVTNNKLLHLEKIDFSLNEIENLTSNLFSDLVKVKAMSFDKNFIRFVPNDVFSNTGIVHLVLAFNFIEHLEMNAFHGLEDSLEYLDLERNQLRRIPDGISILNKLRYLYFTSNLINRIDSDNYVLPTTLKVLSLSGNSFVLIPSEGLANCTDLTYLNMGYNKIAEIQENEFIGWGSQLQTLLLRNNKITSLNYGVFNGLDSIKEISLSFNDIHYVHPNVFENISKSLKILELSFGIYRDDFPLEALSHLTELMWLGLDNNNLKVISENSLSSLSQLTYINFGFNRIKVLPRNTFLPETHRNLMEIDLSYNLIEKISSNTFDDLPGLQIIHLTSNSIAAIEKYGFHNLPLLMYLDLTHNHLRNISDNAFVFLPNCLKLDFMFNDLQYFSLTFFKHVTNSSSPMSLNISHNKITKFNGEINSYLYIYKLDASNNLLHESDQFDKLSYSLKFLYLSHNNYTILSNHAFGDLDNLELLDLSRNLITLIRRRSFQGLVSLQELNLCNNKIEQLQVEQFSNLKKLRILKLNGNRLKALPRDVFLNTRIEYLDLSNNFINLWPSSSLSDVGFTLRSIQFGNNQIEYIDSTMFINIQFLLELNLTNNKITLLPDITFSGLSNLTVLDLSFNPLISTNFKELFLNSPKLKILYLKSTGLYSVPQLNLEHLTELDLSVNNINDIYAINDLRFLKILRMSQNKIVNLTNFGKHLPGTLLELDISRNPIRKITQHDFNQLKRLEVLNIEDVRITNDIFVRLTNLKKIYATAQPNFSEYVSRIAGLKFLHVTVNDDYIDDMLFAKLINNTKINEFIVTGSKLTKISNNAFDGLARNHELTIRLRKTLIDDIPAGIFYALKDVPRLTIDISNNLLSTLSPDSFYPNSSSWDAVGTRSIVGGMDLSRNPLQCDCGLVWLGHWLRRWLRETSQANLISKDEMKAMIQKARQSTCHDQITGKEYTILEIFPEDLLCHASALSSIGNSNSRFSIIYVSLIVILFIYQHRIFTTILL